MDMLQLLRTCDPDIWDHKIKLVRHATGSLEWDLPLLLRTGYFDQYECRQVRPVYQRAEYLLSFLADRGARSRFLGCRRIVGETTDVPRPPVGYGGPPDPGGTVWYHLEEVPGFETLVDRMVVDWGKSTRAWVQWLSPKRAKRVIEVLPRGYVDDFPGYDDLILPYAELQRMVSNPTANRTWHVMLGAVSGVYLITDTRAGDQYVGSAYGVGGLLGRWQSYARTGHGGNKKLRELLAEEPTRVDDFAFSILRTLPLSSAKDDVIEVESLYKRKLGTRAHGLNAN